ncbi:MAG: DNA-3-methyladenine glycosylase family protein [Candidatus Caccovivens sp.]
MKYEIGKDYIQIFGKDDFDAEHILECGQIFSYKKSDYGYQVLSWDKSAKVYETAEGYLIKTDSPNYFENFFDLKTDYGEVKKELSKHKILQEPIKFGHGIRILRQNLFETLISFIVSANNNIKRIQLILNRLRERLGTNMGDFYAFPTREQLLKVDEQFFSDIGAGYRAKYLYKVVRQIDEDALKDWQNLPTKDLRNKLIELAGVGPKVADCVLLFGYGRGDVFPVDTWIAKMYNKFYVPEENREKIRYNLTDEFGCFSGYAQQYLFFFMRIN